MKMAQLAGAFGVFVMISAGQLQGATVGFAGGTAFLGGGGTTTTNNSGLVGNVDFYEEGGYRFDFIGDSGSQFVGNYYGLGDAVLHAHFDSTPLTAIRISRIDGGIFDLVSLDLTSNTQVGGGAATGLEQTFLNASYDGSTYGASLLLPSENWGGATTLVTPGSAFTNLKYADITVSNFVYCVGMDNVVLQESLPEPSTLAMFGLGGLGLAAGALRRRFRKAA